MSRQLFVWEVHVRRELIDDELARLREVPYSVWKDAIGVARSKSIVGRDSKTYIMTVAADWERKGSDQIAVTLTLEGPGVRHGTLTGRFVVSA